MPSILKALQMDDVSHGELVEALEKICGDADDVVPVLARLVEKAGNRHSAAVLDAAWTEGEGRGAGVADVVV